jgi:LytS/YehU family sensor histidine kinase
MDASGVSPELPVPPGVLHTLVENALTHGGYRQGALFRVHQRYERGAAVLAFEAPRGGAEASEPRVTPVAPERTVAEGFGLTYVRARLRAAFGEHATLVHGPSEQGGWRTELRLGSGLA